MQSLESRKLFANVYAFEGNWEYYEAPVTANWSGQGQYGEITLTATNSSATLSLGHLPEHDGISVSGYFEPTDQPVGSDTDTVTLTVGDGEPQEIVLDENTVPALWGLSKLITHDQEDLTITLAASGLEETDSIALFQLYVDTAPPPEVTVSAIDGYGAETGPPATDTATVRFSRTGDTSQELTVSYSVANQTTSSDDYHPLDGQVTIAAGMSYADVVITPVEDEFDEDDETLAVNLLASADYKVGEADSAIVTLADRGWPFNGVIQNRLNEAIWIWNDKPGVGWQQLGGGMDTPGFEDWDYIYIGGKYWKVGASTATVEYAQGGGIKVTIGGAVDNGVPSGEWTPPPPP